MPTPRSFQAVSLAPRRKRRGRPSKKVRKVHTYPTRTKAKVSQLTRDRLVSEAMASAAYEGMHSGEVAAFVNSKIDQYIQDQPYWFGHLRRDQPKQERTEAQRAAFESARQCKEAIKREAAAPYVPESTESSDSGAGAANTGQESRLVGREP